MTLALSFALALAFAFVCEPLWVSGFALFGGFWALETIFPAPAWLSEAKPRGRCVDCPYAERRESCGECE